MNNSSFTYDNTSVRTEGLSKKHPDVVARTKGRSLQARACTQAVLLPGFIKCSMTKH